jgi:hypothetical protein
LLFAPVTLPNGATITAFSFTCLQNTASTSCSGTLFRDDFSQIATVSISAQSSIAQTASTTTISTAPAGLPVVDNQNFSYFVFMSVNGTGGVNFVPIRATVTYTTP